MRNAGSARLAVTISALALASWSTTACTGSETETEETTTAAPVAELAEAPVAAAPGAARPESSSAPRVVGATGLGLDAIDATPDPAAPADPADPVPAAPPPADDPGPAPTSACSISKDAAGFFTRSSAKGSYVAYVPSSYDGSKPLPVLVGMHGCGDTAYNYATWGVAPAATRATQQYIGISLGSESGANKCWSMGVDDDKVLAAVEDVAKCFWVHQKKVVVGGFSSGGQLAYRVGLSKADRFAGVLIECSGLYAAGNPDALLTGAPRKIPIAHRAHTGDTVFQLSKVKADWAKISANGFSLASSEVPGGHDGNSADWTGYLLPKMASWVQ